MREGVASSVKRIVARYFSPASMGGGDGEATMPADTVGESSAVTLAAPTSVARVLRVVDAASFAAASCASASVGATSVTATDVVPSAFSVGVTWKSDGEKPAPTIVARLEAYSVSSNESSTASNVQSTE